MPLVIPQEECNFGSKGEVDPETGESWKLSGNHIPHSWAGSPSLKGDVSKHISMSTTGNNR